MKIFTKYELTEIALRPSNTTEEIINKVAENMASYPIYKFKRSFEKATNLSIKYFGNNKFIILY